MTEIRFDQSCTCNDAKTFVKLPFDMPAGIERIEVEYDYPRFIEDIFPEGRSRREANIIDLGIFDEQDRLWGWSGSNQKAVYSSSVNASPGYRHGIFAPGKWAISLGLYKIENTVNVSVILRMYPRELKLYRGDLHMHTSNSDGSYKTSFVIESCEKAGLDFIALTDHNNMKQNSEIGNPDKISVIRGVEFTNYRGHANFFFPDSEIKFYDDFLANSFDEMAGLFYRAKKAGAVISINHPVSDCPWEFGFENFPFDMIEVWNGIMRECNIKSIELWNKMLCDGKRISAVAGSDLHSSGIGGTFGCPCTFVNSESPDPPEILKNLVAGRSCISYAPEGPILSMEINGAGPGGAVLMERGLAGNAIIKNARKNDSVKIINNSGAAEIFTVPYNGIYSYKFPIKALSFYRLELYRPLLGAPILCALSNPVYIQ